MGEGPVLVRAVEAAAEVEDGGAEGLAGPVEGTAGEAHLGGSADDFGRGGNIASVLGTAPQEDLDAEGACAAVDGMPVGGMGDQGKFEIKV